MEPRGLNAIPLPYEVDEAYHHHAAPPHFQGAQLIPSFLKDIKQEDIILIGLIILLLAEGNECDYLLVGILVVIFLAGLDGNFFGI